MVLSNSIDRFCTIIWYSDREPYPLSPRSANKGQLRVGQEYMPGKHFLPVEDNLIPEELESDRRCIGRAATVFLDCFLAGSFFILGSFWNNSSNKMGVMQKYSADLGSGVTSAQESSAPLASKKP